MFDIFKLFAVYYNILSSCVDIRTTFHVCYATTNQLHVYQNLKPLFEFYIGNVELIRN